MIVDDVGNEFLRRGEALAKRGDRARAIEQYLLYCEHIAQARAAEPLSLHFRSSVVRRLILDLDPTMLHVRYELANDFIKLELVEDAKGELQRVVDEAELLGDLAMREQARERLAQLGR